MRNVVTVQTLKQQQRRKRQTLSLVHSYSPSLPSSPAPVSCSPLLTRALYFNLISAIILQLTPPLHKKNGKIIHSLRFIDRHSGLARSLGRTICRQILFNESDLRTQICCTHVRELSGFRHAVDNSKAREFAWRGGANQLFNFCNKLRSKLFNFKFVGPLVFPLGCGKWPGSAPSKTVNSFEKWPWGNKWDWTGKGRVLCVCVKCVYVCVCVSRIVTSWIPPTQNGSDIPVSPCLFPWLKMNRLIWHVLCLSPIRWTASHSH